MKISPEELSELCDQQRARGISEGIIQRAAEVAALLKENAELKYEVASFNSRAKHMEDACGAASRREGGSQAAPEEAC